MFSYVIIVFTVNYSTEDCTFKVWVFWDVSGCLLCGDGNQQPAEVI